MATFDPAAATAAYLAQLSPEAHAKATAYTQGGHWLLLWGWLVTFVACVVILKSGILARTEAKLESRKPHPLLASFLISAIFLALDALLEMPWESYARWWREKEYGLTSQPWTGWAVENLIGDAIGIVAFSIFFVALYFLMRRAPKSWPLWAGVLTSGFILFGAWVQPAVIEPIFNTYKPAPPGQVRDLVVQLGQATGVPTDKIYIYNGSKQSNRYTANVSGLFGTARVAMSDTMFAKGADLAEVRGVVGHEMGHYVHRHVLWDAAFQGLMAILASWLLQQLFPVVRRLLGASDVGGVADPAGLPIVMIIATTLVLIATPLFNTETRTMEADADSFSLKHAGEPDGLAKALVKTIEYRASSPSDLEELIFYDHPSVEHRVRKAMDWKAAHMAPEPKAAAAPATPAASAG